MTPAPVVSEAASPQADSGPLPRSIDAPSPAAITVAAPVLGLVLGTAAATAATPNDAACRKVVSGSVSHTELLAYDACRFDKLDAVVKALTPTDTPSSTPAPTPTASPTRGTSPTSTSSGAVMFSDDFTGAAGAPYDHAQWGEWGTATYNSSAAYGNIKAVTTQSSTATVT